MDLYQAYIMQKMMKYTKNILKENSNLTEEEVRDFCRGKIARHKIPKYVLFVNEFPLTGSGKIQKFKLGTIGLQLLKEKGIEVI